MTTIAAQSPVQNWPRAAIGIIAVLVVALAVTIALSFTVGRQTTARTVIRLAPAFEQPLDCRVGRPC